MAGVSRSPFNPADGRVLARITRNIVAVCLFASAVCVAGVLAGKTDRKIKAHLDGGDLELEWRQGDGCVYMTGPAAEVFTGDWNR